MRIVYCGTPEFAVPPLEALIAAGHEIPGVYTQPDRPKGRGHQVAASPVKEAAVRYGLPVFQPERIRGAEPLQELRDLAPELMVVVGYGQILPQAVIDIPPRGILNVHASLLPKYRGAAPIQWSIAEGERTTGVTVMQIDAGMDTGPVLLKRETEIGSNETAPELAKRLAQMGANLLIEAIERLDTLTPEPQNPEEATYAPMLRKEHGLVDWTRPAGAIYDQLRGFTPWPGVYTTFRGRHLQIFQAKPVYDRRLGPPGSLRVVNRSLLAACGADSALELLEVQLEGRKRVSTEAFRNGQRLLENEQLGEIKH